MKRKAIFLLSPDSCARIYGPDQLAAIHELTDVIGRAPIDTAVTADDAVLRQANLVFGGWGTPSMNRDLLARLPALEAVFYGAGSIRGVVTPEFWARGIPITSSYAANAVPVAEFAEAQVVLALKRAWPLSAHIRGRRRYSREGVAGAYGTTVGLISLGAIGRLVAKRMQSHAVKVLAYDPFVTQAQADDQGLGVRMTPLDTLFAASDVVSLHAPNIPATKGMITRALLASLKPFATFINTARGAIVDEAGMTEVLAQRPDLTALLDVTYPEPPAEDSPLYTLPNVFLTPHIAGSLAGECNRMGQVAVEECRRFIKGEPLQWAISREMAANMA